MILRDPVYGLVSFEQPEAAIVVALLEARELQRLRRIRQLGLTSLAYPGADHTRLAHALGTAHVMTRLVERLRSIHEGLPFWQRLTSERARDALAAALLHDVGHGPFSHLFEEAMVDSPRHEEWTTRIILDPGTEVHRILTRFDAALPARVAELVCGRHPLPYLARAVSGTFDVDRCDYLLRDAYFTGVSYGSFDLDWLLRSFRFDVPVSGDTAPPLAIDGAKGLPAVESFLLARLFMFQQVYFHKASRASEWMLGQILRRARELLIDGTPLPATPPALRTAARDGEPTLGEYLDLDDSVLWSAIQSWRSARDPLLSDLCRRICDRRLFKTYELYGDQLHRREEILEGARAIAREHGLDPDRHVGLDGAADHPYDELDERLAVLFPRGERRRPSDVSFLLGRLDGQVVERVRLIFAPELRPAIEQMVAT